MINGFGKATIGYTHCGAFLQNTLLANESAFIWPLLYSEWFGFSSTQFNYEAIYITMQAIIIRII